MKNPFNWLNNLVQLSSFATGLCSSSGGDEEKNDNVQRQQEQVHDIVTSYLAETQKTNNTDLYLRANPISFVVNGQNITLDTSNVSTNTSLARYLRNHLNLTGTKISCGQAGCGACVVTATFRDAATGEYKTRSVNSVREEKHLQN